EIPEDDWTYRLGLPPSEQWRLDNPRHPHDVRGIKGLCDRYAEVKFSARDLWLLHKGERPYPLQGDFRTAKSNAMKSGTSAQWTRKDRILGNGPVNPNRGVGFSRYKMLGLPAEWSTTVRIERVVRHAKLRQHFFVCPVCGNQKDREAAATRRVAGPAGRRPAAITTARTDRIPGRCTKLYLPLCTAREGEDALLAQLWLDSHPRNLTHPNRPLSPEEAKLIERYSALFAPRRLRCRQCLGLRYGEMKGGMGDPPVTKRRYVGADVLTKPSGNASTDALPQPPAHGQAVHASNPRPRGDATATTPPIRRSVARRLPIPTEQTLFLQNLPKLLAKPATQPPLPTREDQGEGLAEGQSNPSATRNYPSDQAQLLAEFCQLLPSFKRLAKVKELTK
ncbi:MAG: hypothetical protein AAF711_11485, partial [Planctomycetota bacterium]